MLLGGFVVAVVSFADTSVLSRSYAARMRMKVDPNQEMVGLGAANLAAGFFQGIPISSSASRTPVAEARWSAHTGHRRGGRAGDRRTARWRRLSCWQSVPETALAAVVIAAAIGLIEVTDLRRIYRIQRWEFWLSMVCLVGVAMFGAVPGIAIAIVIAVIEFLWDGWRPHSAVLGRVDQLKGYHDISRYPQASLIPGLVLFRWDAPLFFANAELFRDRVLAAVAGSPTPVQCVVVAAEPVTSVDVTAADSSGRPGAHSLRDEGVRAVVCGDEGSGEGQAQALRALCAPRPRHLLSNARRGRQSLPDLASCAVGRLGRRVPIGVSAPCRGACRRTCGSPLSSCLSCWPLW